MFLILHDPGNFFIKAILSIVEPNYSIIVNYAVMVK